MGCFRPQQHAQGSHVRGHRVRAPGDRSWPMLTATIDPRDLHAGGQGSSAVKVGVVADVQHGALGHARGLRGGGEDAAIRLADADLRGVDGTTKELADAYAVHVGIALLSATTG